MGSAIAGVSNYDYSLSRTGTAKKELDPDAFLQLLVAQVRYQDPMNGMDQNQFMMQLASMTSAQQQLALNEKLDGLLAAEATVRAVALIGHTVKGVSQGSLVSGEVTGVSVTDDGPLLKLTNGTMDFFSVVEVS